MSRVMVRRLDGGASKRCHRPRHPPLGVGPRHQKHVEGLASPRKLKRCAPLVARRCRVLLRPPGDSTKRHWRAVLSRGGTQARLGSFQADLLVYKPPPPPPQRGTRLLGRRQVVRHRFLVPAFAGSNPAAPAKHCRDFREMAPPGGEGRNRSGMRRSRKGRSGLRLAAVTITGSSGRSKSLLSKRFSRYLRDHRAC